jgi:DNA repair ATPase RecN
MSEGRRFVAAQKWREARDEFAAVIALDPVNFQAKELLDQSQQHVNAETKVRQDLEQARSAFEGKDYQGALWKLYRLPRDPGLGDIDRAIRNSWFNWAVMGLKNGDATNALQKLSEALAVDPEDTDATRLQEVAERYASRPKDKVFYSFVDGLKYRAFDQK